MTAHHLAQLNVALPREPLDTPAMAGFVARLEEVNALADTAPGFVWRLVDDGGSDATALRPYGPDLMVNMSVWESVETLYDYMYRTAHLDLLRRRREWFSHDGLGAHSVLWWVPAGRIPTLEQAHRRLDLLAERGPTAEAFTFQQCFPAPDSLPATGGGA
jgi:hypothetical protein